MKTLRIVIAAVLSILVHTRVWAQTETFGTARDSYAGTVQYAAIGVAVGADAGGEDTGEKGDENGNSGETAVAKI